MKILVVDDDLDAADSLVALLRIANHDTNVAYGGQSALTLAAEFNPDAIFVDINMPRMNGYATATALRQMFPAVRPLLIAFTALSEPADIKTALDAGFDLHLGKPCEFERLLYVFNEALTEHRARAQH